MRRVSREPGPRGSTALCAVLLAASAGCLSEVKPARSEVARLRIFVAPEVEVLGENADAALRDGLGRDLRQHLEQALGRAGFGVASAGNEPHELTAHLSVDLESHRLIAGTKGTARMLLRDSEGRGVDGEVARVDAGTFSATAFADRAGAALATALGQSDRLAEVARRLPAAPR